MCKFVKVFYELREGQNVIVSRTFSKAYALAGPVAQAAIHAIQGMGAEPKIVPMIPGSLPQVLFSEPPLNLPFVVSGLGHGWLQHAPNEYFEVEGLRSCEKSAVAFLYEFAGA